jgi:transposase
MSFQSSTILVALKLSNSLRLVGTRLPGAPRSRMHRLSAGDTAALLTFLDGLRSRQPAISDPPAPIACCFEAGRDGFWLHRLLTANGIPTYVVEPASILVNRRAKRAKTDRTDAEGLLRVLAAYLAGDGQICSMVQAPTSDEEDSKRLHRELEYLVQERTRIENRMSALLAT